MACTTKQQTIPQMDTSEPIKCEEEIVSIPTEVYDEESRKFRKHMAHLEALRQLEQRKTQALQAAHRFSFNR
jgi:hypothetical protein